MDNLVRILLTRAELRALIQVIKDDVPDNEELLAYLHQQEEICDLNAAPTEAPEHPTISLMRPFPHNAPPWVTP